MASLSSSPSFSFDSQTSRVHHSHSYSVSYSNPLADARLELYRLCEKMDEGSYDLSLRDIVDPPFSITATPIPVPTEGVPKRKSERNAGSRVGRGGVRVRRRRFFWVRIFFPRNLRRLLFDRFSRLQGKRSPTPPSSSKRRTRPEQTWQGDNGFPLSPRKLVESSSFSFRNEAAKPPFSSLSSLSSLPPTLTPFGCSSSGENSRSNSASRLLGHRENPTPSKFHPSHHCSSCSSYAVFFKRFCLACGKMYCCNCSKDCMVSILGGYRCKGGCTTNSATTRYLEKFGKTCWSPCMSTTACEIKQVVKRI